MPDQLEQDAPRHAPPTEPPASTPEDEPPLDPTAVARAYRRHRARRRARIEHTRRTRRAGMRFWVVLIVLLVGFGALAVVLSQQIEQLFGL